MEDLDTPTLLIIAVIIVLVLKPDLLSSLFGKSSGPSSSGGGAYAPGGYVLEQPPSAGGISDPNSVRAWKAAGLGDGSGKDLANRAMPTGWKPGDEIWHDLGAEMGQAATDAFKRAHPCPDNNQVWNNALQICETPLVLDGKGNVGVHWTSVPIPCGVINNKDGFPIPAPCPVPTPPRAEGVPDSVAAVKAANRTAARVIPGVTGR